MKKVFIILLIPTITTVSCSVKTNITKPTDTSKILTNPSVSSSSALNTVTTQSVDIQILNPSNSEKSSVDWYEDDDGVLVMKVGSKAKVIGTATLNDQTKSSNIKWNSSDNTLVSINDSGIIQANKIGNTTILATSIVNSNYKQILNVKIVDDANFTPQDLTSVNKIEILLSTSDSLSKILDNNVSSLPNANLQAVGRVYLKDETKNSNVIWESTDENIATVDNSGKILIKPNAPIGSIVSIIAKYRLNPKEKKIINIEVVKELPSVFIPTPTPAYLITPNPTDYLSPSVTYTPISTPSVYYSVTPSPIQTYLPTPIPTIIYTPTQTATPIPTPTPIPVGNELRTSIGDGKLNKPGGIAVKNDKIYVSNLGKAGFTCAYVSKGQVQVFDTAGNLSSTIEGSCGDVLPTDLTGVATDGSRVWVTNKVPYSGSKQNLYSYITDGTNRQNSTIGLSSGSNLKDMAIDLSTGYIYIVDGYTNSVNRVSYNSTGIINQEPYFINQVNPAGITLDDLGNILVVSSTSNPVPIIKYNKTGQELMRFNTTGKNGAGPSNISAVGDVAYDTRLGGIIYVAAQLNSGKLVILRFDAQGNFIRYFGEEAAMVNPVGMAVGMDGTLYVLDQGKNSIIQFGPAL